MTEQRYVRRLADLGTADRMSTGGKAASLGELARAGIPVPPGFVVTTTAFRQVMDALTAVLDWPGPPATAFDRPGPPATAFDRPGPPASARARINAAPMPSDIAAAITAEYAEIGFSCVAVRSSATMEDSAEASFAGLQDSYLAVRGTAAVLDRVRACWASLYNDESVSYRQRIGVPDGGLAMGVVVQRMVSPRAAGVMFTRSPVTGDRSVVAIEATWGLASALVAGEVTPDSFTVSKVTGEITGRQVGAKLRLHHFSHNDNRVSVQSTPDALRGRPCLTDDQVRELTRLAQRVEDHFGAAQDIEWALLDDGFVLLQSRPETVWAARDTVPVAAPKGRPSDHVLDMFRTTPRWS